MLLLKNIYLEQKGIKVPVAGKNDTPKAITKKVMHATMASSKAQGK